MNRSCRWKWGMIFAVNFQFKQLGARSIYWVHISREESNDLKYIWNNRSLNCGCRWKWRMIWSSQLIFQFKQLRRRSLKKVRASTGFERDSNPWPPRYRCDALPTELWSHALERGQFIEFISIRKAMISSREPYRLWITSFRDALNNPGQIAISPCYVPAAPHLTTVLHHQQMSTVHRANLSFISKPGLSLCYYACT